MEQQLPARLRERQVAELVQHHEVEPSEVVGDAALPAGRASASSRLTRSTAL